MTRTTTINNKTTKKAGQKLKSIINGDQKKATTKRTNAAKGKMPNKSIKPISLLNCKSKAFVATPASSYKKLSEHVRDTPSNRVLEWFMQHVGKVLFVFYRYELPREEGVFNGFITVVNEAHARKLVIAQKIGYSFVIEDKGKQYVIESENEQEATRNIIPNNPYPFRPAGYHKRSIITDEMVEEASTYSLEWFLNQVGKDIYVLSLKSYNGAVKVIDEDHANFLCKTAQEYGYRFIVPKNRHLFAIEQGAYDALVETKKTTTAASGTEPIPADITNSSLILKAEQKRLRLLLDVEDKGRITALLGGNSYTADKQYGYIKEMVESASYHLQYIQKELSTQRLSNEEKADSLSEIEEVKTIDEMIQKAKTCVTDATTAIDSYLEKQNGRLGTLGMVYHLLYYGTTHNQADDYEILVRNFKNFLFDPVIGSAFYAFTKAKPADVCESLDRLISFFEGAQKEKPSAELDRLSLIDYTYKLKYLDIEEIEEQYKNKVGSEDRL